MPNRPTGFAYSMVGDPVVITHRGRQANTLRGDRAATFLAGLTDGETQELT